jgi:hypothetical protein
MKIVLAWFLAILFFTSIPIVNVDERIVPYYNEFISLVKNECPKIETPNQFKIKFDELKNEEVGVCYFFMFRREIKIDQSFWDVTPEYGRRQLIFHELTHCILDTHHVEDENNYMNAYLNYVPTDVLIEQVKQVAKNYCIQ